MKKAHFSKNFPDDVPYRQKILLEAGLNPELHERIRAIAGPSEIRVIVRAFRSSYLFTSPASGQRVTKVRKTPMIWKMYETLVFAQTSIFTPVIPTVRFRFRPCFVRRLNTRTESHFL